MIWKSFSPFVTDFPSSMKILQSPQLDMLNRSNLGHVILGEFGILPERARRCEFSLLGVRLMLVVAPRRREDGQEDKGCRESIHAALVSTRPPERASA